MFKHMTSKMTRWGIGPKFAIVSIVVGLIMITVNYNYFPSLILSYNPYMFWFGVALLLIGIAIFVMATIQVHRGFNRGRLITNGVYAYIRHPVYAVWILFIVPGLLLITGLLFLIVMPFVMYAWFRVLIVEEEEYLEQKFGREYLDYKRRVNAIIPRII
jgi:protein-S-isoprenylcysteine O-methyltransferase Ste14